MTAATPGRDELREQIAAAIHASDFDLHNTDVRPDAISGEPEWDDYLANADAVLPVVQAHLDRTQRVRALCDEADYRWRTYVYKTDLRAALDAPTDGA